MGTIPAASLDGINLQNGWVVLERMSRLPGGTGGFCSVGYKVQHTTGRQAFLKALDLSKAMQDTDMPQALNALTELYLFERDLLRKCKDKKLDRIVKPLLDGNVIVSGFGSGLNNVPYIIFEWASGDIRENLKSFTNFDLAWSLTSLHDVAVGLSQLQGIGVAHQDLKPSNVLIVAGEGSKISDLGSASDQKRSSPQDSSLIPGGRAYAPIDLWYQDSGVSGFEKRLLADLYLLGSLFFFHFAGVSAVQVLRSKLVGVQLSTDSSFKGDLPHLQHAFEETIVDLASQITNVAGPLTEDIIQMVRQLCEPDPIKRGEPVRVGSVVPRYNLQRYISKLDLLSKKAIIEMR